MHDLGVGFGYFVMGQRWVVRHGRWWGFGLLPGLVTLVLYGSALALLGFWAGDLITWVTPFADGWSSPWLGLFRGLLTGLLFAMGLLFAVVSFTAVTLLVGQPFYESLSEQVDRTEDGHAPGTGLPFWRELLVSARESLAVLVRAALWGVLLIGLGFLPVVGQTVIPVLGICVSGFFLTEELTSIALQRRGLRLKRRLTLLRDRRMLVLGFGVPLALLFLVPLAAVFLMPGAVAGATLMAARDLAGGEPGEGGADDAPDALTKTT